MLPKNIVEVTPKTFAKVTKTGVSILDFWATWCPPFKALSPVLEKLAETYKGRVTFGKVDVDKHEKLAEKFEIQSIPTLLIFKNGKVAGQLVGAVPKGKIEAALAKVL